MASGALSDERLIDWAIDEVHKVIGGDAVVQVEPLLELEDKYYGYADLVCGEHIFDLKSGGIPPLPGYKAHELVLGILDSHLDENSEPVSCTYCKWCKHTLTCKALTKDFDEDDMKDYDLNKPEDLAEALHVAKRWKIWAEAVEKEAKKQLQEGNNIDGWKLQTRKGRESIDIGMAHKELYSRMGSDKFLACCSMNLTKLRKIWAEFYENEELPVEEFITRSKDSVAMVEDK